MYDVYQAIDMQFFEGHGTVEGMQIPAGTVQGDGNDGNANSNHYYSATQQGRQEHGMVLSDTGAHD